MTNKPNQTEPSKSFQQELDEILYKISGYKYCLDKHFDSNFEAKTKEQECNCTILTEFEAKQAITEAVVRALPRHRGANPPNGYNRAIDEATRNMRGSD